MLGDWEIHKKTLITLAYIAGAIGSSVLFIYVLAMLVGPVASMAIFIAIPAVLGLYHLMYLQTKAEMLMDKKLKDFEEDIKQNGRHFDN